MNKQRAELTYKDNLKRGRHGWLRLTPAYSVRVVEDILSDHPEFTCVLDPFSGTGTTGLVCAQQGISCDLVDINPFLVWFAGIKTHLYTPDDLEQTRQIAPHLIHEAQNLAEADLWVPKLANIERWWSQTHLMMLAKLNHVIQSTRLTSTAVKDLLTIAFCRVLMGWSNAAFNHQSMSFKAQPSLFDSADTDFLWDDFLHHVKHVLYGAAQTFKGQVTIRQDDARWLNSLGSVRYDAVITSPPYVNRMSYVRELRPYMFWLGYLTEAREAGELDWQAIGGTWGIATSRLNQWKSDVPINDIPGLETVVNAIKPHSDLLARYVWKYFVDIAAHIAQLPHLLKPGAQVFYIIGNSKFYDTVVHAEQFYGQQLEQTGFRDVTITPLRKRNSKKELVEFLVSARYW